MTTDAPENLTVEEVWYLEFRSIDAAAGDDWARWTETTTRDAALVYLKRQRAQLDSARWHWRVRHTVKVTAWMEEVLPE
jgi:hypothetical protein